MMVRKTFGWHNLKGRDLTKCVNCFQVDDEFDIEAAEETLDYTMRCMMPEDRFLNERWGEFD